ncbi:hypothetical protein BN1002_00115 [Bacillus sp. B-jedd]|nr:hypothetical protein BN1002_00115 [Bacillus sp. B-jedd]
MVVFVILSALLLVAVSYLFTTNVDLLSISEEEKKS